MDLKTFVEDMSQQLGTHRRCGKFQLAETLYITVRNGKIVITNEAVIDEA